ncbi:MAG TPA: hypothetical protein VKA46_10645 [Gemmataceae bacterium]|nr:hypothetical protein [Gemmataceae bacterium]
MRETTGYARWTNAARYADLWALLRRLGFDCDTLGTNPLGKNTVRICEYAPNGTVITLADYPPDQFVRPQILFAVRLQLDSHSLLSSDEFDRWAKRRAKTNAAKETNGTNGATRPRKSRTPKESP